MNNGKLKALLKKKAPAQRHVEKATDTGYYISDAVGIWLVDGRSPVLSDDKIFPVLPTEVGEHRNGLGDRVGDGVCRKVWSMVDIDSPATVTPVMLNTRHLYQSVLLKGGEVAWLSTAYLDTLSDDYTRFTFSAGSAATPVFVSYQDKQALNLMAVMPQPADMYPKQIEQIRQVLDAFGSKDQQAEAAD